MKLNIIIVGFNEEQNLPKLFDSLLSLQKDINTRIIYIDQDSTDSSSTIARSYGAEVYMHPNTGYADNDKRWAYETLCKDGEWMLFLDADESILENGSKFLKEALLKDDFSAYLIPIETHFLGIINGIFYQPRLLQKGGAVVVSDTIHKVFLVKNKNQVGYGEKFIYNFDKKTEGSEISTLIEKQKRYAMIEQKSFGLEYPVWLIYINLFWKPMQWFFGWGIMHRLFLKGVPGLIYCGIMAYYQFMIYSILYERKMRK